MALAGASAATKGVDSLAQSEDSISSAKALAAKYSCVVVVSGETDYVTDGDKTEEIKGGHYLMGLVTGTGCMATSIIAAFCAVNQNYFSASVNAMSLIAFAGQKAGESTHGPGVFQSFFMDEIYEAGRE
jgi:hydroxyethylthiazole kinase